MSGWVTVTGPPSAIWVWKCGTAVQRGRGAPQRLRTSAPPLLISLQDQQLCYPLGRAHDVDRLIRRNEHEALDAMLLEGEGLRIED